MTRVLLLSCPNVEGGVFHLPYLEPRDGDDVDDDGQGQGDEHRVAALPRGVPVRLPRVSAGADVEVDVLFHRQDLERQ